MVLRDQCNRTVALDRVPKRIVSLVPSQTELLYDLGLDREVVGITKFCIHPKKWHTDKIRVGGTKNVNIDRIRELNPDLIIANKEENTKEAIDSLSREYPVWVSDVHDLESSYDMIINIGRMCDLENQAMEINNRIKCDFDKINAFEKAISCLYFIWKDPYMICGRNTFISSLLEKMGFINLGLQYDGRYPMITGEQIRKIQPQIIFLSTEPYPFTSKHVEQMHKEFPKQKVFLVDGELFSWYGSRLMQSAEYLQNLQQRILIQAS